MLDFLANAALLLLILGTSALATKAYANAMYNKCPACSSLNAKRRSECRICGEAIGNQQAKDDDADGP